MKKGTGKTRTIIAAIDEILHTTDKSILVCAQTNATCDEITLRLLEIFENQGYGCADSRIFRIYASSYKNNLVNKKIEPVSNALAANNFQFPSLEFVYQFRVIVCTVLTAGYFSRVRGFNTAHFGYIFIDEAASIPEIVTMAAIAGVCTQKNQINGRIVLAGDPKQLNAVAKSQFATELGYKTSYMERLFHEKMYQINDARGDYNSNYIVQLKKNYRSHPEILKIPNELFYGGILQAFAAPGISNSIFISLHFFNFFQLFCNIYNSRYNSFKNKLQIKSTNSLVRPFCPTKFFQLYLII